MTYTLTATLTIKAETLEEAKKKIKKIMRKEYIDTRII